MLTAPGGIADATGFYADVVGLEPIDRPQTMGRVGAWFRAGTQQLHISEEPGFMPAARAHPAFELDARGLDELAARLAAAGAPVEWDERMPGARRFYSYDPAGNRLEFLTRE